MSVKGGFLFVAASCSCLALTGGTARAGLPGASPPAGSRVDPQRDAAPQAVDPARDPSFDAELPSLDSVQASAAVPAAAPVAPDPALAQPLPPLAGFDPTSDTGKAAVPPAETARIRYTVKVEGLKALGLDAQFKPLSALDKGSKKAANAAQVSARAAEDVATAKTLMVAQGYYDATASSTVVAVPGDPGRVAVTITVTPGTRYDFTSIAITGARPEPTEIARGALPLRIGEPIVAADVLAGEANVALVLPERGYPFAKTGQRDILLDPATHGGDYALPLIAGPRSDFGRLRTTGDPLFTLKHLDVFPRFAPGQPYDQRNVEDLRQALVATSIFSSVAVEPVDTGVDGPDGNRIVDLLVTQHKGPWRTLSGSAGYGTGQGATVTAAWTHRNLFPPEGALTVSATGGTLQQGANVAFVRSNAGQRDRTFTLDAGFNRSDYAAYRAKTINADVVLARQSTPIWQKRWTWSVGASLIGTNEQGAALNATDPRPTRNYLIVALPLQLGYDTSDDLLNPTKGVRVTLRLSPEASVRKGVSPYVRAEIDTAGYQPIGTSIVLAGRVQVGSIIGATIDELAPSRRYYAGAGGSVRGYGFLKIGPQDAQDNPIGGRTVTTFQSEVRYRFGNFGIVPFFDGGRVGLGEKPGISDMRYGVGIGARYYTNFGPLRVDVGTPLNRQPGDSRIGVYIGIGQAF